jgi:cytochrome c oxidase assembly factor CtaG
VIGYARKTSTHYFLIYLFLLTGFGVWHFGARFGQIIPRRLDPRRESAEYVRAMGTLYQKARMNRHAGAVIYAGFRRQVAGFVRHQGPWEVQRIAAKVERKTGTEAQRLTELVETAEALLQRPAVTDGQMRSLCQRLARFEKEVLHGR